MKLLLLILLTAAATAATKTWIEILEAADFHQDHPGKKSETVKSGSQRLDFLEKQKTTIETIILGKADPLPVSWPQPDWLFQFSITQTIFHLPGM